MARRGPRSRPATTDLTSTIEEFASRIGDRIGAGIARALEQRAPARRSAGPTTCAREGCKRAVAAKGLCKSHYNLMLYHRRKAEAAASTRRKPKRKGGRP